MQVLEFGVREFLDLTLRVGGLNAEFSPMGRAAAGMAAHVGAVASRPEGYRAEVPVRHVFEWHGFRLILRGRIDGLREQHDGTLMIEEIKSSYLPLHQIDPERNQYHTTQLRLYHHFMACQYPATPLQPVLTYVHPVTLVERAFLMDWDPQESREIFEALAMRLLQKEQSKQDWRSLRNASIKQLRFPFTSLRAGQAELIGIVEQAILSHQDALVEAATGIGKTMGVLYPAIRHLPGRGGYARIFYLTAKTAGVDVVRKAIATLREQGVRLRVLYLAAKQRLCPFATPDERPECGEGVCPFADDFYTRAEEVIPDMLAREEMSAEYILSVAQREGLCPFELSLELSLYADLIVCDYNYAFDPVIYLQRFFWSGLPSNNLFLVDESHNLVPRSREMYSETLQEEALLNIKKIFGTGRPEFARCLDALLSYFYRWREEAELEGATALRLPALPPDLLKWLDGVMEHVGELLITLPRGEMRKILLEFFLDLFRLIRVAQGVTPEYAIYVAFDRRHARLRLLCLHPGPLLRPRVERSSTTIFFSATLSPPRYYRDLFGAREGCRFLRLPSPFPSENRLYLHVPDVSTKFVAREETKPSVARVIMDTVRAHPGNYLAFFPSFAYLGTVWAEIMVTRPEDFTLYAQKPNMEPAAQADFLRNVCTPGPRTNLGLAVMGGLFGEAVDLPGEQLIGTIIVGPGLPGINHEQDLICEYFDEERNNEGFFYAYVVPGITRVIQAAGRVFRTAHDCGVVVLIDDRFLVEPYRELLPPDWHADDPDFSTQDYRRLLEEFWDDVDAPLEW